MSAATPTGPEPRTKPHPHRGGCAFCRHWLAGGRCAHPAFAPFKPPYADARAPNQACGPSGRLWERAA